MTVDPTGNRPAAAFGQVPRGSKVTLSRWDGFYSKFIAGPFALNIRRYRALQQNRNNTAA
jgi:hypothetical protein